MRPVRGLSPSGLRTASAVIVAASLSCGGSQRSSRTPVCCDEDGDGLLSLDEDGTGEFARAPSRIFPKEGRTMVLTDIWANHADDTDPEGKWVASAALRDDSGEKPSYHENWIADRELTGSSEAVGSRSYSAPRTARVVSA